MDDSTHNLSLEQPSEKSVRGGTAVLVEKLTAQLHQCSRDELRIVSTILDRVLRVGRESYAPLDLSKEDRDWGKEAQEELADTLFYLAARHVAAEDRRLERMRCERADKRGPVEAGLRELVEAKAVEQAPRHWLAEHEAKSNAADEWQRWYDENCWPFEEEP